MPPADLAVTDAFSSVAADGEEQKGAELGNDGRRKQRRRSLDIQQDAVDERPCQTAAGQPAVTKPIEMEDKEKHAQPTGELHDTFKGAQIIFLLHNRHIKIPKIHPQQKKRSQCPPLSVPVRFRP